MACCRCKDMREGGEGEVSPLIKGESASAVMRWREFDGSQWAWIVYDAGTFGFMMVNYVLLPIRWKETAPSSYTPSEVVSTWGYFLSFSCLVGVFLSPFIGGLADVFAVRKLAVGISAMIAVSGVLAIAVVGASGFVLLGIFAVVILAYTMAISIYNSLLTALFPAEQIDSISLFSSACSNTGAALMLGILLALTTTGHITLQQTMDGEHASGSTVSAVHSLPPAALSALHMPWGSLAQMLIGTSLWLASFTLLFTCKIKELPSKDSTGYSLAEGLCEMLSRTWNTLRDPDNASVRQFLLASLLISEGIGTVFRMLVIYAVTVCKIPHDTIFQGNFAGRIISIAACFMWQYLVSKTTLGARGCFIVVSLNHLLALIFCACMYEAWQYWVLMVWLGFTGPANFALSRSLLASIVPAHKASEVFGFNSLAGELSGVLGPLLFSAMASLTHIPRLGFAVAGASLAIGIALFLRIDFESARAVARKTSAI